MKSIISLTSATVLALTAASQAIGQAEPGPPSVSYADLDLSLASGRAALERRIGLAVSRACPTRPGFRDCQKIAWADARRQLVAIYDRRQLARTEIRISGVSRYVN